LRMYKIKSNKWLLLMLFDDAGKIIFDNVQQVSFNFVGLYVLFHLISLASSLDIFTLAAAIPPFLNILIIIAVYLAVNRLHEHRTGLLAAMLYGWENMVHILGQEYRTQTMGVLLLFFITALLLILNKKTARSGVFAVIILLAGLVTTSFVANFYALLVFTGAACAVFIWFLYKREGDWLVINTLSIVLYLAFIVFLVCYLLYVSGGFPYLLAQFSHILYNAAGQALSPEFGTIITKSILLVVLGCAALVGIGLIYMLIKKITKWRPAGSFCLTAGLVLLLSLGILLYTGHSVAGAASHRRQNKTR
jgi:asparagine N-glycosylation enzyme membrane subunit Stt3